MAFSFSLINVIFFLRTSRTLDNELSVQTIQNTGFPKIVINIVSSFKRPFSDLHLKNGRSGFLMELLCFTGKKT